MPATGCPSLRALVIAASLVLLTSAARSNASSTPPAPQAGGRTVQVGTSTNDVAFTADGSRAYVTDSEANSLSEVDLATGRVLRVITDPLPIRKNDGCPDNTCRGVGAVGVVLSADDKAAFVSSMRADSVSRIELATGRIVWSTKVQRYPQQLALTPDGRQVWVFNLVGNSISSVDAATGKPIGTPIVLQGGHARGMPFGRPVGFALAADGSRVYVGSDFSQSLDVYDTRTRKRVARAEPGSPWDLQADATRPELWAQFSDGLLVFNAATLEPSKAYHYCRNLKSYKLALSPDGRHVAVSLPDENKVVVASRETGLLTHAFSTGPWPLQLAFAPDSRHLVVLDNAERGGLSIFDLSAPVPLDTYLNEAGELFCRPEA